MPDDDNLPSSRPLYRSAIREPFTADSLRRETPDGNYRVGWIGEYRQLGLFRMPLEWAELAVARFDREQPLLRHVVVPEALEEAFLRREWPLE